MNADQYANLRTLIDENLDGCPTSRKAISVSELNNPDQDRTLLWGYTCERDSLHVYLKDGLLHRVLYKFPDKLIIATSGESLPCSAMAPDKRAYPAACDEQFAQLMVEKNQYVSYTTFDERPDIPFHGKLLEELQEQPHVVSSASL